MTYTNALLRFIICPALVAVGDLLFRGVYYPTLTGWVVTGVVLALASVASDMLLLDRLGHAGAFVTDTAVATVWVWASQYLFPGALITWPGALGTGLLLGLSEIAMHRWVQLSRRRGVRENRP